MSALAEVDVYNLSLSHIGSGKEIQATTENSAEANACRRFFAQARDEILAEFPWPFARVSDDLALVEEQPTDEWLYSYRYPIDAVFIRRIVSGTRAETQDTRVPYQIARDSSGRLIYCDLSDAVVEYTQAVTDTTAFDPLFAQALAFKLAFYIAPRVTSGDNLKLGDRAFQSYRRTVEEAKCMALDEQQDDLLPDSEFIRARDS